MQSQALHNAQAELAARRPKRNNPAPVAAIIPAAIGAPPTADEADAPANGSPAVLSDLDLNWHPMVAVAAQAARAWQHRRRAQQAAGQKVNASLVLISTAVPGDVNRTGYGCGKTHIARACLWSSHYAIDGQPVAPAGRFFMAADIINRLDGETHPSGELADTEIVVVDDVGAEGFLPYIGQDEHKQSLERTARYFKLLDYCWASGKSLIVTGNLSLDQLAAHIGGRAWSRLMQMAPAGFMIDLSGVPDYRRKAGGR